MTWTFFFRLLRYNAKASSEVRASGSGLTWVLMRIVLLFLIVPMIFVRLIFKLLRGLLDPRAVFHGSFVDKFEIRRVAHTNALADQFSDKAPGARQAFLHLIGFLGIAQNTEINLGMLQIFGHLDRGDRHKFQTRIFEFRMYDAAHFPFHGLID